MHSVHRVKLLVISTTPVDSHKSDVMITRKRKTKASGQSFNAGNLSMIEYEFVAIENGPEDIDQFAFFIRSLSDTFEKFRFFFGRWLSRIAADVYGANDIFGCFAAIKHRIDKLTIEDLASGVFAIEQMQGLGKCGIGLHFAAARCVACRTTERIEEVMCGSRVGDMNGSRARKQSGESILSIGYFVDAIQQNFRKHAPNTRLGEVALIPLVRCIRGCRQLICGRVADISDQRFDIELVFRKLFAEFIEQKRIRGWIADSNVIHRFYDSNTHKVGPYHVGKVIGEGLIISGG